MGSTNGTKRAERPTYGGKKELNTFFWAKNAISAPHIFLLFHMEYILWESFLTQPHSVSFQSKVSPLPPNAINNMAAFGSFSVSNETF